MTVLTMRYLRGHFVVTGPDIEPLKLKSRREAKDWCDEHHQGSPIKEIGANAVKRASKGKARRERECLMTWLQPSSSQLPRSSSPACLRIAPLDADRPEISRLAAAVLAHKGVI